MNESAKRIWYQGFTDPVEHHEYFNRLQALVADCADEATQVDCHGVVPSAKHVHGLTEFRCAGQAIRNAIEAITDFPADMRNEPRVIHLDPTKQPVLEIAAMVLFMRGLTLLP